MGITGDEEDAGVGLGDEFAALPVLAWPVQAEGGDGHDGLVDDALEQRLHPGCGALEDDAVDARKVDCCMLASRHDRGRCLAMVEGEVVERTAGGGEGGTFPERVAPRPGGERDAGTQAPKEGTRARPGDSFGYLEDVDAIEEVGGGGVAVHVEGESTDRREEGEARSGSYLPVKLGGRFSTKAMRPSRTSWLAITAF